MNVLDQMRQGPDRVTDNTDIATTLINRLLAENATLQQVVASFQTQASTPRVEEPAVERKDPLPDKATRSVTGAGWIAAGGSGGNGEGNAFLDHIRMGTPLPEATTFASPAGNGGVSSAAPTKDRFSVSGRTGDWNDFAPPSRRNPLGQFRFSQIVNDLEIELAGRTNTLEETKKVYAQLLEQAQERERYLEQANEELRKKVDQLTRAHDDLKERRDRAIAQLRG